VPDRGPSSRLFNASGRARELRASPLFAIGPSEPGPAIRRGFLLAVPIGLALIVATALAEAFGGEDLILGTALTIAAGLSFGLLTVQYALFTAAITTFVVLMSTTLGEGAFDAAGQRATGTALGIAIAFLAWRIWPNPRGAVDLAGQPNVGGAES
jgi:uncharacterized membrane protein YccC